ncbi:MAG: transcriptional regulator [Comamonadaceae bacterium SCN 68-20]|nr:transcriptional regulator [Comamonadaceae bacterium]ODU59370.1 MAG: transcriptional regulator [Comamonadaceae bacterium SCN 68-20]OJX27842.1 MAG: transcriptional regulator [Burkholderiales bacterium 68-20]
MEVRPIRTPEDYQAMLAAVSALIDLDPEPESPEGERLEVLGTLVEAWEARHYPMAPPSPIEAVKFYMDQKNLAVADMEPYIGPRNRVYQVLKGTRPLTMPMIRRLMSLGIPAESLIGAPEPVAG